MPKISCVTGPLHRADARCRKDIVEKNREDRKGGKNLSLHKLRDWISSWFFSLKKTFPHFPAKSNSLSVFVSNQSRTESALFSHRFMCQLCANFRTIRYSSIIATDRCHRSMLCMFYCNDIYITSSSSKCTITVLESSRQSAFAGAGDDGNTGNIIDRRQWRKATRLQMNTSAATAAALSHLTFSIYTLSFSMTPHLWSPATAALRFNVTTTTTIR